MDHIKTIEVEFPGVLVNGKYRSLDLSAILETNTYKKIFMENDLAYMLMYGHEIKNLCHAEYWMIKNNPKYDYLWKKEKGVTLE